MSPASYSPRHEEAGVQHLLLRPAEFEEVVRCLQPLLHLGVVLGDNAVDVAVYRPHALHFIVDVLQCAKHSASQGGEVIGYVYMATAVDRAKRLLVHHQTSFRISPYELTMMGRSFIVRDFGRRWLTLISLLEMSTPMSCAMPITTSSVFSSAVSGTPCSRDETADEHTET